ncbi:thiamine diphosphokinase [Saccharicrinis sp. FJH54]|uniref:thiamine diphosphokinase n=1 Tax=Saccharicrinis sp. FJH54 TaxID=3344665 RepID=UPI0035D4EFD0
MQQIEDLKPGVPVILADGLFPESQRALEYLHKASTIICCDGATVKLLEHELKPDYIVGDMDSLPEQFKRRFEAIISSSADQLTNDLTKAVNKALELGLDKVVILGATGLREDHTMGNIGLLAEHGQKLQLQMVSDYGIFNPVYETTTIGSFKAQQVSIFSVMGNPAITLYELKYPLNDSVLKNLWEGTLNEALGTSFRIEFTGGALVVFRAF